MTKYIYIPIPTIIKWDSSRFNKIDSEYILIDIAPGVSLQDKWLSITLEQRIKYISNVKLILSSLIGGASQLIEVYIYTVLISDPSY